MIPMFRCFCCGSDYKLKDRVFTRNWKHIDGPIGLVPVSSECLSKREARAEKRIDVRRRRILVGGPRPKEW